MSRWSSYRVQEAGGKDERSIRELVREEMTNARIVSRRIHEERVGVPKKVSAGRAKTARSSRADLTRKG
jgi:hypothetical protein